MVQQAACCCAAGLRSPPDANQACYGYVSLAATRVMASRIFTFSKAGDLADVADLDTAASERP